MRVVTNSTYGPPSILEIKDVNKPFPDLQEVFVKVEYSSVNRTDVGFVRGRPFVTSFLPDY